MTLLSSVVSLVAAPAAAQLRESTSATANAPEIATSGRGEVRVSPDVVRLQLTVETSSSSANLAASDNATRVTRTIAALRAAGVDSAQIRTAGYSVGQDNDRGRPSGFIVRNSLRVEVQRIVDVGRIIDAALTAGATQVNSVQFARLNVQDARRNALALAVAEARRDAEALAGAAGGTLGRLIYLTNGFVVSPQFQYQTAYVTSGVSAAATPIMPGDLDVIAIANARWQFLPRQAP